MADGAGHDNTREPDLGGQEMGADLGEVGGVKSLYWRAYWRVTNGFEVRVLGRFFWLNFYGIGVGKLDPLGLGRGQFVHYWRKPDRVKPW